MNENNNGKITAPFFSFDKIFNAFTSVFQGNIRSKQPPAAPPTLSVSPSISLHTLVYFLHHFSSIVSAPFSKFWATTLIPKNVVCCVKLKLKISTKTIEAMFDLINLIFVNTGLCESDGSSKFQMRLGWGQQKVSKVVKRSENDSVEHSSCKQVHG